MSNIYLVRHGETDWNKYNLVQGWHDIGLNETGLKQARLLSARFKGINIDKIYTSDLKRARATAEEIRKACGASLVCDKRLREVNFGGWEGKNSEELYKEYGEEYRLYKERPHIAAIPGEGSLTNALERVRPLIDSVLEEGREVVLVSHGSLIKLIIIYIFGLDMSFYNNLSIYNTSVSIVRLRGTSKKLLLLNDTHHLGESAF